MPVERGATKSDSATLWRPSRLDSCWRSVCSVASVLVRSSLPNTTMSSPSVLAGQKPSTAAALNHFSSTIRRSMDSAGRRSADQERNFEALPLHLGCDQAHLVERRRDQAGQADQVGVVLA